MVSKYLEWKVAHNNNQHFKGSTFIVLQNRLGDGGGGEKSTHYQWMKGLTQQFFKIPIISGYIRECVCV